VAIEVALELGCTKPAAVRHLLALEALVRERPQLAIQDRR
jgi:hypothetical protein